MATAEAAPSRDNQAALLFTYRISDTERFDEEYRQHLGWHRDHKDHLAWYGWYVIGGARTGMFVDGTFGSDFAAIDRRPDLKGDAEHFMKGAAHYSTAVQYSGWSLWPGPSTDFSLEDQQPSPLVDVLFVTPRAGEARNLERVLESAAKAHTVPDLRWTWYRAAAGERMPSYMVLMPRHNWAEIEGRPRSVGGLAAKAFRLPEKGAETLDRMVESADMETWRYRADLSLFPERN